MQMRRASVILLGIFLLAFGVKSLSILSASTVPPGWIDTSYHVSTALDVSEGNFDSLVQPWWHINGNSRAVDGITVIDRTSNSFFYPPFLHLLMAGFMLFLSPGIASIASISMVYSLAGPAVYVLSRSYDLSRKSSLLGSGIAAASTSLMQSQLMGFWSFAAAFIFGISSFGFYRLYTESDSKKHLLGYALTGLASILTHWVFGAFIIGMPVLDILLDGRKNLREDLKIPAIMLGLVSPFYAAFFATSSITSYITTSFGTFIPSAAPLLLLAGLITVRDRYRSIRVLTAGSLAGLVVFYILDISVPFGNMIQFALPVLAGFYVAVGRDEIKKESLRKFFTLLMLLFVLVGFMTQFSIGSDSQRSISQEDFNKLVEVRNRLPDKIIVPGDDVGSWVTLASVDRPVANSFGDYKASELDNERFYYLNLTG
jgi:hypothetical protein